MIGWRCRKHSADLGEMYSDIVDIITDGFGGLAGQVFSVVGPIRVEGTELVEEVGGVALEGKKPKQAEGDQWSHGGRSSTCGTHLGRDGSIACGSSSGCERKAVDRPV